MFPIGDDDTARRTTPIVTYALIALNILFFFVELSGGDPFIEHWSVVPRRLLANPSTDFPTIFTSMFMHAGWLHLGGNMLYLWIFGDNVEDSFGHFKFLIFYFLCGIAATPGTTRFQCRFECAKPRGFRRNRRRAGRLHSAFPARAGESFNGQRRYPHAGAGSNWLMDRIAVRQWNRINYQ
jgi:membrane associated rhomboid family serine protease